jgi:hypothetical protein
MRWLPGARRVDDGGHQDVTRRLVGGERATVDGALGTLTATL